MKPASMCYIQLMEESMDEVRTALMWQIRTKLDDLQLYGVMKPVVSVVNYIRASTEITASYRRS